jgi:hypothetical protein
MHEITPSLGLVQPADSIRRALIIGIMTAIAAVVKRPPQLGIACHPLFLSF